MRPIKKLFFTLILMTMLTGLAAGVNVEITSYPSQTTVDESANISVTVLDGSTPQNNTLVNFTTTLGNLSVASVYTNSSGIATTRINSTTTGSATVNASVGGVYNITNLTFLAGETTFIDVNATQNPLIVGNTTVVNLTAYDQYNNINSTVNLTLNILISDTIGEIKHDVNITGAPYILTELVANRSNVSFTNSTQDNASVLLSINSTVAGNVTLTANAENATSIFNITYAPAALYSVSVVPYLEITVNKTLEIIVSAWDMYDNPLNGTVVLFNATPPPATQYNSPTEYNSLNLSPQTNMTNLNGYASTVFRADKRAGDNIINITVENINASVTVLGLADDASILFLTQTPDSVYANNKDAYSLKAQVVDKFLNPILPVGMPITDQVLFTTTSSSTLVPLNDSGIAVTLIGPTAYIETITITATYKNVTGYTNLTNSTNLSFVAGNLSRFIIYANPDAVLSQSLNGNHVSTITVTSLDEWGHPVPGINITLNNTNTTLGNLTIAGINATNLINTSTDSSGYRQAIFTSNTPAGNSTINVSNGSISASAVVGIKDQPFLSVNITFEPASINSGDTVNMTTIISVEGELPLSRPAASAMLVLDRSGSMDPDYYAGTPLDVALVIDRSGSMADDGCIGAMCQPLTDVKNASKSFMSNLVSNAQVAVISYSGSVTTDVGLTPLNITQNRQTIERRIDLFQASGSTAMGDAMTTANTLLVNGRNYAKKVQVVLTDGNWNAGVNPSIPATYAKNHNIVIYTIGLGNDINELELYNIAWTTGGKYYHAPAGSDLMTIYNSIAQDISDYDITERHYGIDGFTPYVLPANGSLGLVPIYKVGFEGYGFDTIFTYSGSKLGEALIRVNSQDMTNIPPPLGLDDQWDYYEYNITDYVVNGSNNVSFYDYYTLLKGSAENNSVRNIVVYQNGTAVRTCSAKQDLTATAYNCSFNANITQDVFTYTFNVNDTINDIKAEVTSENPGAEMDLQLKSPSGHVYGWKGDSTGYYSGSNMEYVWVSSLSGNYPNTDNESAETGIWTVNITGKGNVSTANFTVNVYIDKKSAAKTASREFISSFDTSRGDRAGVVLYSYSNITSTISQRSYLRNGSTWAGFFEGGTPQSKSYRLNFTGRYCDNPYNGYGECYITVNGAYAASYPPPYPSHSGDILNYSVDITSFTQSGSNTVAFYDYADIYGSPYTNKIKDVKIFENGNQLASYPSGWIELTATPATYTFNATFNVTTFNLTWNNTTDNFDLYLYKGTTLVNFSNRTSGFEELSAPLYSGYNYHVVVDGVDLSSETNFTLIASQSLNWNQWFGNIAASLNDSASSFDLLNNSINTMTADGLTAIDEGLYQANNQFSSVSGNSTIVLMTDGIDNAGYHSMLVEAELARQNHTVIYTIGFGKNEAEVDPVLSEIANITGGRYYFAPNADELKSIFRGIAANLTNFTAEGATLNLHLPHNYVTDLSLATATYVTNSSNSTTGDATNFIAPTFPQKGNAEPNVTYEGNISMLTWELPNLMPGEKWGVWYQLIVQGAGYVPLILPSSNITYTDMNGTFVNVNIVYEGGVDTGGTGADVNYIALGNLQLSANPPVVFIGEPSRIMVTAKYVDGNPAIANATLDTNLGYFNDLQNPLNNLTVSGSGFVNFISNTAGQARINAIGSNGNNSVPGNVVIVVKPKGRIIVS